MGLKNPGISRKFRKNPENETKNIPENPIKFHLIATSYENRKAL